jgi:choice-of-anchor A domain-containing protein
MCTFLLIVTAPDVCGEAMVLENDDDLIVFTEENGSPVIVAQNDNLDNDTHALIEEPTSEAKTLATAHRYSGDYTLDYLMNHFGIIAFGNVDLQQHCMGNLLIKGDLSGNHNNFADSPNNVEPSYIGGYVSKPGGPNGRSKYTGVPLYVGGLNTVAGTTLNVFERYNHDDPIYVTDDYISWDSVYAAGTEEVSHIQSLTADLDPVVTQWNWQEVTVTRGAITNLITNGQYCKIHLSGEATGTMTVINILDSGSVINPQVVGLSQGEENGGSEPICIVYPNANTVVIPTELTPEIGCVLAPYADI